MIYNYTIKKCTSWLICTLCLLVLAGRVALAQTTVYSNGLERQKRDSIGVDTTGIDIMSDKNPFLKRGVSRWNTIMPRYKNIAAVSTIYAEDINSTPVSNITNVLSGRLPGLYTVQSTGRTGSMYDLSSLTLRGQAPILVIDGVIRSFTSFNPNDIKSITVMKDALSTAMYGLRSSNGVVYITTKDRSEDRPFELNFSAQYGFLEQLKTPNFITGAGYASLYNEAQLNTFPGATPAYSSTAIAAYQNGTNNPYTSPSTNWFQQVYKNNANQQRYGIDAAGNGKTYRYYLSLENFSQKGNFVTSGNNPYNTNNDYNRYNVRTNAQVDFSDNIQLSLNIFGGFETYNEPGNSVSNILSLAYATSPFAYPVYNADGSYGGNTQFTTNVVANTLSTGYINYNARSVNADVALKFKLDDLLKGLWLKGAVSVNNNYLEQVSRTKAFAVYYPVTSGTTTTYTKIGSDGIIEAGKGVGAINNQLKQTYASGILGYDAHFGKNSVNVLGTFYNDNIINSYTQLNQIYQHAGIAASFDHDKKYLAELTMAYSGLNRYAPGKRWGFLPALGLGWIVSNESWFKQGTINYLKLKGTVGKTAMADPSNYYLYLQNYTTGTTGYNFGSTATAVSGSVENTLANPNITWEKAWKWDGGIEAAFFNNHLNVDIDYYNNHYYDQLQQPGNGYASGIIGQGYPVENLRKTRYSGIEASVGYNNKSGAVGYFVKGNISVAKNKLIDANEGSYPYSWMYQAGGAVGQTMGYQAIGFYQAGEDFTKTANIPGYTPQPGDVKYQDLNGDGIINFLDQKAIAGNNALVFGGLNLGASYKGFDISALLQGVANRQMVLSPSAMSAFSNSYGYVLDYTTENRWTPQNTTNATLPRLTLGNNTNNQQVSTLWVRNANYLRLKNVELGYTFPTKLVSKAKINKLRVFVNAYNLFTWTKLQYFDPESLMSAISNQRIINGGVKLGL